MLLGGLATLSFLGVYLVFAGQVSATELLAGIPAAIVAAGYTVLLHRAAEQPLRLDAP